MQNLLMSTNGLSAKRKCNSQEISLQDMQACYLDWQRSGLNKTEFCRQKKMSTATFYRWMKELSQQDAARSMPTLIPVTVATTPEPVSMGEASLPAATENAVDIWLPSGIRLRVSALTALSPLTALIQELSHANTVG